MTMNPNEHLMQIKSSKGSSDYLPVAWRLVWFREQCPNGTIDTEEIIVDLDREVTVEAYVWNQEKRRSEKVQKTAAGYARFKAVITDGKGGRATGTGSECAADFGDYIEKAETKAVGRALAMLGYGTQFAPELNEEHRIVDSPVERHNQENENSTTANNATTAPTYMELVKLGISQGVWTLETFYATASAIIGESVTPNNIKQLSVKSRLKLQQAISEESAVEKAS